MRKRKTSKRTTRRRRDVPMRALDGRNVAPIEGAMKRSGLSRSTIYRLMKTGALKGYKALGRAYVDLDVMDRYLTRDVVSDWHGRS